MPLGKLGNRPGDHEIYVSVGTPHCRKGLQQGVCALLLTDATQIENHALTRLQQLTLVLTGGQILAKLFNVDTVEQHPSPISRQGPIRRGLLKTVVRARQQYIERSEGSLV